ncbi:Type VI secretion system needle syringe protein TssI [uncultured Desulfobacterium sp.]|uniref:Type VI secretion system needle syringe protein TssI n=1 Tax=uncultured Desulfobacterium sp. TaxID=201089 RepID=A0A445MTS6_9BACT|nr:Type VI secretion system needle syringe protein TssI [uncultured Desulfobacterium sp.]
MPLTQENRKLVITTPLGENAVILTRFSGTEGLSVPFSFDLDLVSESSNLVFHDIIGEHVTVSIGGSEGERRFFNGIISRFALDSGAGQTVTGRQLASYSAKMVPWFWLLTRYTNSRIFQDKSVPDIVEQIFTEKGFRDYRKDLGSYEPREYCVQYNETDFNFVSRLLEQEGIFYFFEHEDGKHTMVLADAPDKHHPCPNHGSVRYHPVTSAESPPEGVISDVDKIQEIRIGKYTVNDFNFETPNTDLKVEANCRTPLGPGDREFYDFPAEYRTRAEGERIANIRMQAEEVRTTTVIGAGSCRGFTSGCKFDLTGHYRDDINTTYVLASVNHNAVEPAGDSGDTAMASYINSFTCFPYEVPYRPPLITPKPMIAGVQTAIVVGPSGEEIYTDEHGRVKVQFHWDRARQYDDKSSCWIRVSQPWAGTGWGAIFLPRIGQEVIVDFIESDPDRPIITGRVYNGLNTPPYSLPDAKTKSTIKSMSSPDSGGVNEIRFEDKSGEEQLFIQAQKIFDTRAKDKSREYVGLDRHLIVKGKQLEKVEGDKHLTVMGDHNEKVNGTISIQTASGDILQKSSMNHAVDAGMEVHIKGGMKVVIEASTQVTMKVGGNFVDIGPAGVFIKGTTVMINSGGAAGSGSGCSPAPPEEPEEADTTEPGSTSQLPSFTPAEPTPQAVTFKRAAQSGAPFCET